MFSELARIAVPKVVLLKKQIEQRAQMMVAAMTESLS